MISLPVWSPLLTLAAGAFAVYLMARTVVRDNQGLALMTAMVYAVSLGLTLILSHQVGEGRETWKPQGVQDAVLEAEPGAMLITITTTALGLLVALYSGQYLALDRRYEDFYPLLLGLSGGIAGMVMAVDLFTLYLFTVLSSAAAYILVSFRRRTETAIEAGFKYAIMGGTGAILILAGIGYLYRAMGRLTLPLPAGDLGFWGALGAALVLSGYAIKGAIVPAHTWLPDAHGRAPSSISAVLSGILIEANVYVLLKVGLGVGWPLREFGWALVMLGLANMTLGNLMALMQVYGKRLLGYSSIAQVGYMLMALGLGLTMADPEVLSAGLFLLAAHAAMKGLAFLCKGVCHFYCDATRIDELDGMATRVPVTAGSFVIALAGLAGLPPLAGFTGKWQLLVAVSTALDGRVAFVLALFILNNLLSLGYYIPLIGRLMKRDGDEANRVAVSPWMLAPVVSLAATVLILGIFPGPLLVLTRRAARYLLTWGQ